MHELRLIASTVKPLYKNPLGPVVPILIQQVFLYKSTKRHIFSFTDRNVYSYYSGILIYRILIERFYCNRGDQ
jgi:hypothetical protein